MEKRAIIGGRRSGVWLGGWGNVDGGVSVRALVSVQAVGRKSEGNRRRGRWRVG